MNQTIRIIGGQYRGKKLHFPVCEGLRPTPDRIRETLFNWLMQDIRGARCLDAFAGSGALGFEAYSRGASHVVLIEEAKEAYLNLKKIALSFDSPHISVVHQDALLYLKQLANRGLDEFDIVFVDPPFAKRHLLDCIHTLASTSLLTVGGFLYLESDEEQTLDPAVFESIKLKRAGLVVYALYKKLSNLS